MKVVLNLIENMSQKKPSTRPNLSKIKRWKEDFNYKFPLMSIFNPKDLYSDIRKVQTCLKLSKLVQMVQKCENNPVYFIVNSYLISQSKMEGRL